jgi:hypothetical protein
MEKVVQKIIKENDLCRVGATLSNKVDRESMRLELFAVNEKIELLQDSLIRVRRE